MEFVGEVRRQLDVSVAIFAGLRAIQEEEINVDATHSSANIMLFSKACDNFQTYLVDLLTIIYTHYPHALYRKKIDLSSVFEVNDIEVLRRSAIERQVAELSYAKLHDLCQTVERDTGCRIFSSQLMLNRVGQMMNIRNVITHNRGIVSKFAKERLSHRRYLVGQNIFVYDAFRASRYLFHCAKHLDKSVCAHFKLPYSVLYEKVQVGVFDEGVAG